MRENSNNISKFVEIEPAGENFGEVAVFETVGGTIKRINKQTLIDRKNIQAKHSDWKIITNPTAEEEALQSFSS